MCPTVFVLGRRRLRPMRRRGREPRGVLLYAPPRLVAEAVTADVGDIF
ncbi:hypothetical protein HRTV-11_gp87 [Halorubrum virus HRTV-11]|nr:hypothetical protein HRTV-11_gp87 [Halorubrum virus HRTV-11]